MKYTKPPLTIEAQVELLFQRGMEGDCDLMAQRLKVVNYYRLSGYWHTFRQPNDMFKAGTSFDLVWNTYAFDRHLRLLVMDAIERIEIAVRSLMAYHHAHEHGPFAYVDDPTSLPKLAPMSTRNSWTVSQRRPIDAEKDSCNTSKVRMVTTTLIFRSGWLRK